MVFFSYFHFSFSLFSCNCARFVLVSLSHPFLHIIFSFYCGFIPFFFNLIFRFSSFYFPILLGKKKIHCMCLFFLYFPFFLSPNPLPFHSIGTREVVTQKNLSGLVPVRDLRLDPSLLCSIPLLALSPNLLIVWLFLSIAYLVAKLRCKWASWWKISKSQENKSASTCPATVYLTGREGCVRAWPAKKYFMPYSWTFCCSEL